ncbi:MAG TPA: hypothetical protein VHF23_04650, partial [Gaiellaceae bacterium]|nr:hypothetical protein [Gaiellaceae bacterium]
MRRPRTAIARLVSAVLAGLAALALAGPPAAAQAPAERLPTELWDEYPLDPTQGAEEPAEEPAEPGATTPTVEEAPASPAGAQSEAAAPDEGATPWATLLALTLGISGAVGLLLGVVLARRRGVSLPAPSIRLPVHGLRLPVRRLRVPAPSLRLPAPSLRLPAPSLRLPAPSLRLPAPP